MTQSGPPNQSLRLDTGPGAPGDSSQTVRVACVIESIPLRAVISQCGMGDGRGCTVIPVNPAVSIHPRISASENTHPSRVVYAMFTANKAENCGAACVASVIRSITTTRPPGRKDWKARRIRSTMEAADS